MNAKDTLYVYVYSVSVIHISPVKVSQQSAILRLTVEYFLHIISQKSNPVLPATPVTAYLHLHNSLTGLTHTASAV